jgi:hypothetical protein
MRIALLCGASRVYAVFPGASTGAHGKTLPSSTLLRRKDEEFGGTKLITPHCSLLHVILIFGCSHTVRIICGGNLSNCVKIVLYFVVSSPGQYESSNSQKV